MIFEKEYATARIRSMKGKLLKKDALDSIRAAKTKERFVSLLHKTTYEKTIASLKSASEEERTLDMDLFGVMKKIHSFAPKAFDSNMCALVSRTELENLKTIIRHLYAGNSNIKNALNPTGDIYTLFCAGGITDLETLGNELKHTKYYAAYMSGYVKFKETNILRDLEAPLEKENAKIYTKAAKDVEKFFKTMLELEDFCALARLEKSGLKKEGTFLHFPKKAKEIEKKYAHLKKTQGPLEKAKEEFLLLKLKNKTTEDPFSFFVAVEYMIKKEREIRILQAAVREVVA